MTTHSVVDHLHRFGLAVLLTLGAAVWYQPLFSSLPSASIAQSSTVSQQLMKSVLQIARQD